MAPRHSAVAGTLVCILCSVFPAMSLKLAPSAAVELAASIRSVLADCKHFDCIQRYVDLPDSSYGWIDTGKTISGSGPVPWKAHILTMTSQTWLSANDTDHGKWNHQLAVIIPSNLGSLGSAADDWASLYVGRGSDSMEDVREDDKDLQAGANLAVRLGLISAVVFQVPNQYIKFAADPTHTVLQEEDLKAFTWLHVFEHPERPEYLMELANAKAVVRAMDTVTAFTAQLKNDGVVSSAAERFALTGFSKRGAAIYHTAAVDKRVKALLPGCIEFDTLGQLHKMHRDLGKIPMAAAPYHKLRLETIADLPTSAKSWDLQDPHIWFKYSSAILTMPKFHMAAGNDDFFPPDAARLWRSAMPGKNTYFMRPNVAHTAGLYDSYLPPAVSFLQGVILGEEVPRVEWSISNATGVITANQMSDHTPLSVTLWRAGSCGANKRRDFRYMNLDSGEKCAACGSPQEGGVCTNTRVNWESSNLTASGEDGRSWVAQVDPPADGSYAAFFISFSYSGPGSDSAPYQLTTEVSVVPDTSPFADCSGEGCISDGLAL